MSEKMTCPACKAHTSSVLAAVSEGNPCPYCGLRASTILEIDRIQQSLADERLKTEIQSLIIVNDQLVRKNRELEAYLFAIGSQIGRWSSSREGVK